MSLIDKQNTEKWYWGYAFQGAVVLGAAPILLPIIVAKEGGAAYAGLVVAAFYLGELLAPLWGMLTDKTKWYKVNYMGGFVLLAVGLALFPFTNNLGLWVLLALIQGSGAAASNTVAGMYIVEFRPKAEWDKRIGWLQTFYGAGQTAGLGLAAVIQARADWGMVLCGALMIPAFIIGRRGLPNTGQASGRDRTHVPRHHRHFHVPRHPLGFLHGYHRPTWHAVKKLVAEGKTPFGVYMLSWFLIMFGTWCIYNLYPLIMREVYHINPGLSSLYYAVAAFLGIFCYAPSGTVGNKVGDAWVLMTGIVMTLVSAGGLAVLAVVKTKHEAWLAPIIFILQPVAWSPLIVAGSAYTAQLAKMPQGAAMGMFNANTALASVLSALAAGGLASWLGYQAVPILAAGVVLAGLVVFLPLMKVKVDTSDEADDGNQAEEGTR